MSGLPWYELDVLAVGDGERSGDAMAMRYSVDGGPWSVAVIDGGNQDTGQELVDLIRREYRTDFVNNVINTHPDSDHSSGLSVVLDQLRVGTLWMHKPWERAPTILDAFGDDRLTETSVSRRVREALCAAHAVYELAIERRVPVVEPFQGAVIDGLVVMSPTMKQYLELLPHFRSTPPAAVKSPLPTTARGLAGLVAEAVASWVPATPANENASLGRSATAAENESSVVLFGDFGGEKILLTGDAGQLALTTATTFAAQHSVALNDLRLLQVPHHGSRNNLSASVLNMISARTAFVSAAARSPTHPRRAVTNALQRRGTDVYATRGKGLRFQLNAPARAGWRPAAAVPWYDAIEAA